MATKLEPIQWHGCYDLQWAGVITPASMAHPAKYSRGLITRIFEHCLERGYLKKGDIVGDCFGGVGTGGIMGAYAGLRWIGVELEPRFVTMARRNFALHTSKWRRIGAPRPVILRGDSRKFDELIGQVASIVSSPPFNENKANAIHGQGKGVHTYDANESKSRMKRDYVLADSPGQIGSLPAGDLSAVVSSPPWENNSEGSRKAHKMGGVDKILACNRGHGASDAAVLAQAERDEAKIYGDSPGQIGKLKGGDLQAVVSSPPYAESIRNVESCGTDPEASDRKCGPNSQQASRVGYGQTDGQIGRLKAVVSSPPYADIAAGQGGLNTKPAKKPGQQSGRTATLPSQNSDQRYGKTEGQISRENTETYWQAVRDVYSACRRAIKPDGVMVLVLKDYIKAKKRVPLADDTVTLCESLGFVLIERIQAMLVSETRHADLFSGEDVQKKSRKSFFRRLAESKGSPEINHEDVLIFRRA